MNQIGVVYFSATGRTKQVASWIIEQEQADGFEIQPKEPYTKEDLDWTNKNSRTSIEMKTRDMRPEIIQTEIDFSRYDTIYLGFPIWWYVAPNIIHTFLESYDLSGKKVIVFATSEGSGFGKVIEDLKTSNKSTNFIEGKVFSTISKELVMDWLETAHKI